MNLEELRAFLAVAHAGSFLKASKQSGAVRSTLTRRIESMERRLGVRLIHSDEQGVSLTDHGRKLRDEGPRVLAAAEAAEAAVLDASPRSLGTLHGVLPEGSHSLASANLISAFRNRFPDLAIVVQTNTNPVAALANNGDFAIHWGEVPRGAWFKKLLCRVPFRLLASHSYIEQRGQPRTLEDLDSHDLLLSKVRGLESGRLPLLRGGSHGIQPQVSSHDFQTLANLACLGKGIAWMPALLMPADEWPRQSIVDVLPEIIGAEVPFWLVTPKANSDHPVILEMAEQTRRYVEGQIFQWRPPTCSQ